LVNSCQEIFRCGRHCCRQALFRSYGCFFAEFLGDTSLVRLGLLDLTTCVGLRYGFCCNNFRSFSRKRAHVTSLWRTSARPVPDSMWSADFPTLPARHMHHNPISGSRYYPSSLHQIPQKCWNINQLSIDCDSRHCLRTRLTLGRSPLPRKPQCFGGRGSHPPCGYLCQHSYFHTLQHGSRLCLHSKSGILSYRL